MRRGRWDAGRRRAAASQRGAATAEFAVALPAVILLLGALVTAMSAGIAQVRVEEAARAAARAVARGESPEALSAQVLQIAGPTAEHAVEAAGATVTVRVTSAVPGPLTWVAGLRASAEARLTVEGTP